MNDEMAIDDFYAELKTCLFELPGDLHILGKWCRIDTAFGLQKAIEKAQHLIVESSHNETRWRQRSEVAAAAYRVSRDEDCKDAKFAAAYQANAWSRASVAARAAAKCVSDRLIHFRVLSKQAEALERQKQLA